MCYVGPALSFGPPMPVSRRRLLAGTAAAATAGGAGLGLSTAWARYYDGPVSDHFDGVRFFDPHGVPPKSFADLLRWWRGRDRSLWPEKVTNAPAAPPAARVEGTGLRVTFVGHASMLVQAGGLNILLDPVWSERVSPFAFAGPKRVRDPGIAFEKLPPIDLVLVSHCHYDHLDLPTLSRLAATHKPRVITPLGNDAIMRSHDSSIRAEAYDWHQRVEVGNGCAVTLAPMRHWSARHVFDRNKALWAAFIIDTPAGRIYHVGDSGYGDGHHFRAARDRYGPFRLAILPVGAYEPRWFMQDQHMDPYEAVKAFRDCGADWALGHHHETIQLTDEAFGAPRLALADARDKAGITAERFRVLEPGAAWDIETST
jgi:L-ascorbate metabolism protein UlaG (beta-lactamase superfamily)